MCHPSDLNLPHLQGLEPTAPTFTQHTRIDVLLGLEEFAQLVLEDAIRGNVGEPIAMSSTVGWLITGSLSDSKPLLSSPSVSTRDV